jgi:hypothetical protein
MNPSKGAGVVVGHSLWMAAEVVRTPALSKIIPIFFCRPE